MSTSRSTPQPQSAGGNKRHRSPSGSRSSSSSSSSSSARSSTSSHGQQNRKHSEGSSSIARQPVAAFVFRRDLRLYDNTALLALCAKAATAQLPVLPLFFFNPVQCDEDKNPYFGRACFQFLCESLVDLDGPGQLDSRLVCLKGDDEACFRRIQRSGLDVKFLGFNEDITPFAAVRDEKLRAWCASSDVEVVTSDTDYTLLPPTTVTNQTGSPYSVFTAFYNRLLVDYASQIPKTNTTKLQTATVFLADGKARLVKGSSRTVPLVNPAEQFTPVPQLLLHGGRTLGLARLAQVPKLKKYNDVRDDIAADKTSHLAPHLKFGTVSIREVWELAVAELGRSHGFSRQLIWREFYAMLLANHPRLVGGQLKAFPDYQPQTEGNRHGRALAINQPFLAKYLPYTWRWSAAEFTAFKDARTGVPLVDAAVRCLTTTGWCHNRTRMVIANYLVKVLGVDWREGERWFATVGVDFDVGNNSGGWLWSSGQGADAQPYFRTFNPFRQSERFDPQCEFIYAWLPALRNVPPAVVHAWDDYCKKHTHKPCAPSEAPDGAVPVVTTSPSARTKGKGVVTFKTQYPAPIVNIRERTQKVIAEFKKYDPKK